MDFYAYPSHYMTFSSLSVVHIVQKVTNFLSCAVSSVVGNVFSAIFTFFFALADWGLSIGKKLRVIDAASLLSGRLVREADCPAMLSAVQKPEVQNIFKRSKGLPGDSVVLPTVTIN
ncbi:hypothetical protein Leryth_019272 [Lithospermum erythrorhizon]|nr:hypothetical protein Leryth_019272 [Lithospermum erythrorhizon]